MFSFHRQSAATSKQQPVTRAQIGAMLEPHSCYTSCLGYTPAARQEMFPGTWHYLDKELFMQAWNVVQQQPHWQNPNLLADVLVGLMQQSNESVHYQQHQEEIAGQVLQQVWATYTELPVWDELHPTEQAAAHATVLQIIRVFGGCPECTEQASLTPEQQLYQAYHNKQRSYVFGGHHS